MPDQPEPMAYVGLCPHGRLRFAVVDEPDRRRDVAKDVARAMRQGLTIVRWTCEEVRNADWRCAPCESKKARRKRHRQTELGFAEGAPDA